MSRLWFDEPRSPGMPPRRHASGDAATLTIDVDHAGVRTTAKTRLSLKQRPMVVRPSRAISVAPDGQVASSWSAATLTALCDRAEHVEHAYLRREMARLSGVMATVVATCGDSQQHMHELHRVYRALHRQVLAHMFREEYLLFSDIRRIERTRVRPFFASGIVSGAIQVMQREHQSMRRELRLIHRLTRNCDAPAHANDTFRDMLVGLYNLDKYMRKHIQNEDDVLFVRAAAFQDRLMQPRST